MSNTEIPVKPFEFCLINGAGDILSKEEHVVEFDCGEIASCRFSCSPEVRGIFDVLECRASVAWSVFRLLKIDGIFSVIILIYSDLVLVSRNVGDIGIDPNITGASATDASVVEAPSSDAPTSQPTCFFVIPDGSAFELCSVSRPARFHLSDSAPRQHKLAAGPFVNKCGPPSVNLVLPLDGEVGMVVGILAIRSFMHD